MAGRAGHRGWGRIRQLPSKRYQANYVGPDQVRHNAPSTFSTKMDAEAWLASEHRLVERDEWTPPGERTAARLAHQVTISDYATQWIDQRPLKARTRFHYRDLLRLHIAPVLGERAMKSLTAESVRVWYAGLGDAHPRRNSHAYALLHAVCNTAVIDGLLLTNPCKLERVMNPPRRREPVILTAQDVAGLADAMRPDRLKCLVLLAAWCGVRWGEVSELRRKDVDADCRKLYVSRAVTRRNGEYRVDTPKSGKGRVVSIPPHIQPAVRHHMEMNVDADPDSLLFPAARGGHMNDRVFSREYFAAALASIGRSNVRVHDLRHFAGTHTAMVASLAENMARLGHSTPKASLIYQSVVSGRDQQIAESLSELASNS